LTDYKQDYTVGREQAWYKVAVYHYPATYKFSDTFLDKSAEAYISTISYGHPGTKVTSQKKTQFQGYSAVTGALTVPIRLDPKSSTTSDTNDYVIAVLKGQDLYIISTYGTSEDNYNSFVNSFKFAK
jgi:hypothetical protein